MNERVRTNRIKNLHRLEARYVQAKRSQFDRLALRWMILAFLLGAICVWLIQKWMG